MSEQAEVVGALEEAKIINLFEWAGQTAYGRVFQDFDEDAGHDQAIVGSLGYKYLVNLLDRAGGCDKYALPEDTSPEAGLDLLRAGITDEAFDDMPRFAPGSIIRSNCNGSPGWARGNIRWLLQSYNFGEIDRISWSQKSETKRRVAQRPSSEDPNALFALTDLGLEEEDLVEDLDFSGKTLVLAHAFDRATGGFEMYLGRSRETVSRGDTPWYWRHLVASGGPGTAPLGTVDWIPSLPGTPASSDVADTPVRLRPLQDTQTTEQN